MFKSLKTRFFTQYHLFVFIVIFAVKNPRNPCGLWDFTDVIYFGRHHGCDTGVRYASLFFDRCCGSRKKRSLPTPRGKISFFLRFDEPLSLRESGVLKSPYRSLKKTDTPVWVCPFLAAIQGFEPRQAESEAAVLPLHYIAIPRLCIKPLYYTTF